MVKIFIDPGHGGADPGGAGSGLLEKNITLEIGTRVRSSLLNEYQGALLRMSRSGDQTVSLKQRTDAANSWGADFLLSLHVNAGGGTGYEDYTYPGIGAPTSTYQNIIHQEIIRQTSFADRGKKQANFHVLRESRMPALLTESGFIDNPADAAKLRKGSFLESIARGHANGIAKAFNLRKKNKPVYHLVNTGETVYALSRRYGSPIQQIRSWNRLDSAYTIYPGQRLRVK
ncbi:N-acetylmuramoyl-L-alanine amidase family protein [Bacillus infantis]|uniref:N-acetylmuramoyl-L-alanine amidase family protein n=1 Tax=Bacillus infantis TaxID=324767 RepID=UPI003CEB8DE4